MKQYPFVLSVNGKVFPHYLMSESVLEAIKRYIVAKALAQRRYWIMDSGLASESISKFSLLDVLTMDCTFRGINPNDIAECMFWNGYPIMVEVLGYDAANDTIAVANEIQFAPVAISAKTTLDELCPEWRGQFSPKKVHITAEQAEEVRQSLSEEKLSEERSADADKRKAEMEKADNFWGNDQD